MATKKRGLGRGLGVNALIPEVAEDTQKADFLLPISEIEPNREQPRKVFEAEKLEALAASVAEHGIVQPLIVTKEAGYYRIVAGERRWRAAKKVGLKEVPVIIRNYSPEQAEEVALIENLQREDLSPLEEAAGYKQLMDKFALTQEAVAQKIGRSRPYVANTLRLLSMPQAVQKLVAENKLSVGHAKVLLGVSDAQRMTALAQTVAERGLNVRQTEALLKEKPKTKKEKAKKDLNTENAISDFQKKLEQKFETKVQIRHSERYAGKVELSFKNMKQMIELLDFLLK